MAEASIRIVGHPVRVPFKNQSSSGLCRLVAMNICEWERAMGEEKQELSAKIATLTQQLRAVCSGEDIKRTVRPFDDRNRPRRDGHSTRSISSRASV